MKKMLFTCWVGVLLLTMIAQPNNWDYPAIKGFYWGCTFTAVLIILDNYLDKEVKP